MLEDLKPPYLHKVCKVKQIRDSLDPSDQKILDDAIASSEWSNFALARELSRRGLRISRETLANHERKACNCSKI